MMEVLKEYSNSEFPKEACGIIDSSNNFIPLKNISEDPENYFRISPYEYVKHIDNIKAIFHSHTKNTDISDFDIAGCNTTFVPWLVLILPDTFKIIHPEGWNKEPFVI